MGCILEGLADEDPTERAILTIGLRAEKPCAGSLPRRKGSVVDYRRARRELHSLRAAQVGRMAASVTLIRCERSWVGRGIKPTITCEIGFVASAQELRRAVFRRHMLDLAESAARRFGQEEVWLRLRGRLYRASPDGEASPRPLRRGAKVVR